MKNRNRVNVMAVAFLLGCMSLLADVSGTWSSTAGGLWSTTNNWVNGIVPFGTGQTATFNTANVSVTNDAAVPVGALKYNQGGVNMYGAPLVLDASAPRIELNAGTTHFRVPVVASNGLSFVNSSISQFYQRNYIGAGVLNIEKSTVRADGVVLAPLAGESVLNSVFSTDALNLALSQDGRFTVYCSPAYDSYQNFASVYIKDKGYLDPFNNSSSRRPYITAGELSGPGYFRLAGNGAVEFASTARFSGSMVNSAPTVKIGTGAPAALLPAAGAIMHLDASDADSFVTFLENGTNFVTQWNSQVPGNYAKHDGYLTGGQRKLPFIRENHLNGLSIVDFGEMKDLSPATRSEAPYLVWNSRKTNIKAAFAVLRSQNFIFTDTSEAHYHHNRLAFSAGVYRWDQTMLVNRTPETHPSFRIGESVVSLDGASVNPFSQQLSATEFNVVAMVVKEGTAAVGTIAYDRSYRYGGQQVAEEIFYDRVLTDAEIRTTVAYLRQKWMGVTPAAGAQYVAAHILNATGNNTARIESGSNGVFAVDSISGTGGRLVEGSGTVRAERGAYRPAKPLQLKGGTLQLVNDGPAVDASLSSLNIANMYFHLDASDLSSMTLNGNQVLEWRGASNVTNGLLAYAINTVDNPPPVLVPGRLNGLPVVDFGAWQSGKMLHWNHTNTNIRTLFMVFDHIHRESFWLSDVNAGNFANFHRDGSGIIFYNGYVAGGLTSGQVHLNGKRVDQMATLVPEEEPFLISFTCTDGSSARAAVMASDRYPRADLKFRTGGQRIAEVIVYDRHLSTSEREKIEGYLMRKWLPAAPAGFASSDESATFDGVSTEAAASAVAINVAESQAAVVGAIDGSGALEKVGGGTLAVGSLAGLKGHLTLKEGALRVAQRTLSDPYTLPGTIAYHVDASDSSSIHLAADGTSITNISDASGGPRYATPANAGIPPQLIPNALNGKPVISFLAANSGCAALWDQKVPEIRTVFWVLGSQEGGGLPLGTKDNADSSNFKRSPIGAASDVIWASDSLAQYGVTRIHGAVVNGRTTGFNGGYQLMTLVADRNCIASAFATHKNLELTGGQRLAEVIIYERLLLDQERRDVEAYLSRKWFGNPGSGYAGGDVVINDVSVDGGTMELPEDANVTIKSVAGTTDLVKDGSGVLSIMELAAVDGAVVVSNGIFRLSGVPALPALSTNGLLMHMDASITSSFDMVAENGTNFITRWESLSGPRYAAHDGISKRPWIRESALNGLPVVEFGPYLKSASGYSAADGTYLNWDQEVTTIRSGFFVLGSQAGGNFVVCSRTQGHFHRAGDVSGSPIIDEPRVETPPYLTSAGSYWSLDRAKINAATTGLSGGYQSFYFNTDPAAAPTNTVQAGTFARDRTWRWGGQRLAEFVIYDRILTEQERIAAEIYLRAKWFGEVPLGYYLDGNVPVIEVYGSGVVDVDGQSRTVGTLRGDGTVSNGVLVVEDLLDVGGGSVAELTVDNIELASGCVINVDIAGGVADRVIAGGSVKFGAEGTVALSGSYAAGSYELFTFGSIEGAANLANWQVTGLPEGVTGKLHVSGTTVQLSIYAQGTIIIVR